MTNAFSQDVRRPRAILSRLLLVLALVLIGLPQAHAHGLAAKTGPAAQGKIEQSLGIPTTQRPLLRAQLPDDTSPDAVLPGRAEAAWPRGTAAAISLAPHRSFLSIEIRILPLVRGPPAA